MIRGWHGNNLVQMLALNPKLILAWNVPCVLAAFEHGHDNDFDRDRRPGRCLTHSTDHKATQTQRDCTRFLCETLQRFFSAAGLAKFVSAPATSHSFASLVRRFIYLPFPQRKNLQRFLAKQLLHWQSPPLRRMLQLFINKCIVKSNRGGIRSHASVENARRPRPVNGPKAHRTGLAGGIEIASGKLESTKHAARFSNHDNLRVCGRIVRGRHAISAFGHNAAIFHHHRAKWPALPGANVLDSQGNSPTHEFFGHDFYPVQGAPPPAKYQSPNSPIKIAARMNSPNC